MNNKSKIITAILSILIIVLYFVNEKNVYKFDDASRAYHIFSLFSIERKISCICNCKRCYCSLVISRAACYWARSEQ